MLPTGAAPGAAPGAARRCLVGARLGGVRECEERGSAVVGSCVCAQGRCSGCLGFSGYAGGLLGVPGQFWLRVWVGGGVEGAGFSGSREIFQGSEVP